MNIPETKITIDSEKVCKHMPIAVSVLCVLVFLFFEIIEISAFYAASVMLILGFSASVFLYVLLDKKEQHIVKLDDLEDTVFDENDSMESMLSDLENIVISVNELSSKQIEATRIQTEDAVSAIITRFAQLNEDFSRFVNLHKLQKDADTQQLQHLMSDMLVSFQFQDRTSQILQHTTNSMEMLNDEIRSIRSLRDKGGQPKYDQSDIIKKITAGFTTAEQHALVDNNNSTPSANSVELF